MSFVRGVWCLAGYIKLERALVLAAERDRRSSENQHPATDAIGRRHESRLARECGRPPREVAVRRQYQKLDDHRRYRKDEDLPCERERRINELRSSDTKKISAFALAV